MWIIVIVLFILVFTCLTTIITIDGVSEQNRFFGDIPRVIHALPGFNHWWQNNTINDNHIHRVNEIKLGKHIWKIQYWNELQMTPFRKESSWQTAWSIVGKYGGFVLNASPKFPHKLDSSCHELGRRQVGFVDCVGNVMLDCIGSRVCNPICYNISNMSMKTAIISIRRQACPLLSCKSTIYSSSPTKR